MTSALALLAAANFRAVFRGVGCFARLLPGNDHQGPNPFFGNKYLIYWSGGCRLNVSLARVLGQICLSVSTALFKKQLPPAERTLFSNFVGVCCFINFIVVASEAILDFSL